MFENCKENRIAFGIFSLRGGGAERMISRLANAMVKQGIHVDIILLGDAKHQDYIIDNNIVLYDFEFPLCKSKIEKKVKQIWAIRGYMKKCQPKLVFCFLFTILPFFVLANIGLNHACKIVGTQRTNPKIIKWYHRAIVYPFLFKCDGFVFQTMKVRNSYSEWLREKSVVIGNIAPRVDSNRNKQIIKCAVCSIGRLHTDKDYETLLRAFAQVLRIVPDASLHIYGQGPLKEELQQMTADLCISHNVIFEGFSKNVENELNKYDIFACSSKGEGMPNALMEALAAGLACVATDCDYGPAELIEDGVNGYLVPVGDENKMAEKILYLLQHEEKRKEIQTEARKISNRFSEENIVNAYLNYARKVCDRK